MQEKDRTVKGFNTIAGSTLFLIGCGLMVKNFFITTTQNGYELIFGLELIAGGVLLVQGKFKGFKQLQQSN